MTNLTEERLKEIREREQKATKGPWGHDGGMFIWTDNELAAKEKGDCWIIGDDAEASYGDADFMASSREDIPFLLEIIDSQKTALQKCKDALQKIDDESIPFAWNIAHEALKSLTPPL